MKLLNKKNAALLKLLGSVLLLGAYVAQNFLYERSSARTAELVSAMRDRQMIDKGALLQEVLYFETSRSDGDLKDDELRAIRASKARVAATKTAQSLSVAINAARVLSHDDAKAALQDLFARAQAVSSYRDLMGFFQYMNELPESYAEALNQEYERERELRAWSRDLFLALYVLAAAIALCGLCFEWRLAATPSSVG